MTNIARERLITNKLLLDHLDMWDEFSVKTIKDEWSLRYYFYILNLIGDQINKSIDWLDSDEAEKYFKEESQYHHKVFQSLEDEWDSILEGKYPSVETLLDEVYRRGKAKGYTDMREHVRYTEADKLALEFVKNYNFDLIRRIDDDVRTEIKNKIISGFLAGDNPNLIAPKIQAIAGEQLEGSTFTPRQRATMIAKTEVSRVQNTGMLQSYVNEGYTEVKILTAEDNNVCATCLEYAYEFNKDDDLIYGNRGKEKIHNIIELLKGGSFPPFHPLCRCTYLSVWESKEEPSIDAEVVDLTIGNQNTLDSLYHKQDKFKDYAKSQKIAEELDFSYDKSDNGNEVFTDKKYGVKLKFTKEFLDKLDKMNMNGEVCYSKYDVLKMYKDSPKIFKQASKNIIFTTNNRSEEKDATGYHSAKNETIGILPLAFVIDYYNPTNLNFTLYHEMAHALDHKKSKIGGKYGLSKESKAYANFMSKDNIRQKEEYGSVVFVSEQAKEKGNHEDFAESMAMTALIYQGKINCSWIRLSNGEKYSSKQFIDRFQNRYHYCMNILETDTLKNIISNDFKMEIKNVFST